MMISTEPKTPEVLYQCFIEYYQGRCLEFVEKVIGMKPTFQQKQLFDAIDQPHARIACKSGHGTGKTTAAACIILYVMICFPFSRIIVTSSTLATLKTGIWSELESWFHRLCNRPQTTIFKDWFECTRTNFYHRERAKEWFATLRTARPENPQSLAGQHAEHLLYLVDEASSLAGHDELFDVIRGALTSGPGNKMLLLSNPTANFSEFYEAFHSKQDFYTSLLHWNSEESPLVREEALESFKREYGPFSREYTIRVLGDFAPDAKGMLISRSDIEACVDLSLELGSPLKVVACDVAGDGRDSSVVALLDVQRSSDEIEQVSVLKLEEYPNLNDTMHLTNLLFHLSEDHKSCPIVVDGIGVGKGVVDRLEELGANVISFIAGSRSNNKQRFLNARAENYHHLKRLFEERRLSIPHNHKGIDQLANIPFRWDEKGRLQIESKDKMQDRGLKSPDIADCLMIGMTDTTKHYLNKDILNRNKDLLERYGE